MMLRVTADVFSGRPNPSWIIKGESTGRELLKTAHNVLGGRSAVEGAAPPRLGFRALILEPLTGDSSQGLHVLAARRGRLVLPVELAEEAGGRDLLTRLLQTMPTTHHDARMSQRLSPDVASAERIQKYMLDYVAGRARTTAQTKPRAAASQQLRAAVCQHEAAPYNPAVWNNNSDVVEQNNCYNYACNVITNTFAQPGRGCGQSQDQYACRELGVAALCDGLHGQNDCVPDSEAPRYLVALVIWPDEDFHWYRLNEGGTWSHKRGHDPVTNVDNEGAFINDPAACARDPYVQMCGYFYTGKNIRVA
ncbi:hypothetical protein ACSRUE_24995 [Sorangium sp. KYC3313]|uniref:hypothetical protein n=1 Tax=Sorangium sp. KYC3313 TaxID=3449740 RepID=UPI003F8BC8AD